MVLSDEYIAGFFDGEGCLTVAKNGVNKIPSVRFSLVNNNRKILELVQEKYGGKLYLKIPPTEQANISYVLQISDFTTIIKSILPFLVIKKEVAELALKFRTLVTKRGGNGKKIPKRNMDLRWEIYDKIRILNKRGR